MKTETFLVVEVHNIDIGASTVNRKRINAAIKSWTTLTAVSLAIGSFANGALAQSQATSQASSQASGQAASQATQQSSTQAGTRSASQASGKPSSSAQSQSSSQASSQSNQPAAQGNKTTASGGTTTTPKSASATQTVDLVALAGPTQITHTGNKWTNTPSIVSLKPGQDVLPLTMTFTNGSDGRGKMTGIRIFVNGRKIMSEADFRGKDSVSLKMDDVLSSGDTQMEVQTYGKDGSNLTWVLTTPKIKVSDIKPDTVAPGDKVTINGKNLPKTLTAYAVTVGNKSGTITGATDKAVTFTVPQGVDGGKQVVTLYIAGVKCDPLSIKIKVSPELSGTNMVACPAQSPLTISGTGFSTKQGDNVVTFNGVNASVIRATATTLEVMVPDLPFPQDNVEIKVKSAGVDAKNTIKQDLSIRVIPKGESLGPNGPNY